MSYAKRTHRSSKRFAVTVKVAGLIAALGLVTIMLERPQLTASPHRSTVTVEQDLAAIDRGSASAGAAPERSASTETPSPGSPSSAAPLYFPGQFPLPDGTIDPQPVGF